MEEEHAYSATIPRGAPHTLTTGSVFLLGIKSCKRLQNPLKNKGKYRKICEVTAFFGMPEFAVNTVPSRGRLNKGARISMDQQATVVRFRYRLVAQVAERGSYDFDAAPAGREPGHIWLEKQVPNIWICVTVEGSQDDAEEQLTELQEHAEDWLRGEYAGIRIVA